MRSMIIFFGLIALVAGEHPNPVYRRVPSVVTTVGSPIPVGKSLPLSPPNAPITQIPDVQSQGQAPPAFQGQAPTTFQGQAPLAFQGQVPLAFQAQAPPAFQGQVPPAFQGEQPQPLAEERESIYSGPDIPAGQGQNTGGVAPQTFNIVYYPNGGQLPDGRATYPASGAYLPPDQQDVTLWEKLHLTDVIVGVFSAACIVGGGFLLVPKLLNLRSRSLKELTENLDSDDLSRIARSIFKAFEKYNNMNTIE